MSGTKPSIIVRSFRGQQLFLTSHAHGGKAFRWASDRAAALVMDYYDALDVVRRATREYGEECAVLDRNGVLTTPGKMVAQKSQLQQAQDERVPEPFAHPSRKDPEQLYQEHVAAEGRNAWNGNPDGCYFCGSSWHHSNDCAERS